MLGHIGQKQRPISHVQVPLDQLWPANMKYSDQLANGDDADDNEIEDEEDPNDPLVADWGFVNRFVRPDDPRIPTWGYDLKNVRPQGGKQDYTKWLG